LSTTRGPIHVWIPAGYDRATAGVVVYIHGWYMSADEAWATCALARQFRASRRNAVFLVPEAPRAAGDRVQWRSFDVLADAVVRARLRLPDGPVVAIAHSAGFRTLARWTGEERVEQMVLLDALYGYERSFESFLRSRPRRAQPRMILVSSDTTARSVAFAARFRDAVTRDRVPASPRELSAQERTARLLYMRSQHGHAAIANCGAVLRLALQLAPLSPIEWPIFDD
jgi:pimeloyl-ACP methyl ester carboxylesterase